MVAVVNLVDFKTIKDLIVDFTICRIMGFYFVKILDYDLYLAKMLDFDLIKDS